MEPIISRDDQAVNGNRIRRGLIESVSKFTHMADFGGHRRMHKPVKCTNQLEASLRAEAQRQASHV